MTNQENVSGPSPLPDSGYIAGRRSITQRTGKSRFDILREKKEAGRRNRPFIYAGLVMLLALMIVIGYAYWQTFVAPPRALAIRVGNVEYTRGDVVDLIRFNQRLSEEVGVPFQLGTSVFEALQTIQEAELSYQLAPQYGVSVSPQDVEDRINFILGFALTADDQDSPELQTDIDEAKRQFLNRVGLPEHVWKDFLTKVLFQERLREVVGQNVPRIQPQVHVYQIMLTRNDPQKISLIQRDLNAGNRVEDVVLRYSEDPNVKRTDGDLGWAPKGISPAQTDRLLFGTNDDGSRILPLMTVSPASYDENQQMYGLMIVDQYDEARELESDALESLKDQAMTIFLNEQRKHIDLYLDLNSDINNWVNKQVKLNAIEPSPVATQDPFGGLLPGAQIQGPAPTPIPTPKGIPGISSPAQ